MIEEAVRWHLREIIGAVRPFEVKAAPFRKWHLRLFKIIGDGEFAMPFIDVELDASQVNMRPKAFTRRVLSPALELLARKKEAA